MEQEKNDLLRSDLLEAKASFDCLINDMLNSHIEFPYETVIKLAEYSYHNAFNAITRMNASTKEYNYLVEANIDYFDDEARIIFAGVIMYLITIVVMRLFGKTLSGKQINEMWYLLVGMLLGSINTGIIYSNLNNHRNGSKDSRELINRMKSLKDDYKENYDVATKEIDCLFSLNRNLWDELDRHKFITK